MLQGDFHSKERRGGRYLPAKTGSVAVDQAPLGGSEGLGREALGSRSHSGRKFSLGEPPALRLTPLLAPLARDGKAQTPCPALRHSWCQGVPTTHAPHSLFLPLSTLSSQCLPEPTLLLCSPHPCHQHLSLAASIPPQHPCPCQPSPGLSCRRGSRGSSGRRRGSSTWQSSYLPPFGAALGLLQKVFH